MYCFNTHMLGSNGLCQLKVQERGRVHYSFPPESYDIKAEREILTAEDLSISPVDASTVKVQ